MAKRILLTISAAKKDKFTYDKNGPICRPNGQPFMYEFEGNVYPVTAKIAAMWLILGLPLPKTNKDVLANIAYAEANFGEMAFLNLTADRLYKTEANEYSSAFLIAGWEAWDKDLQGRPYVKNAHLKLNLSALSKKTFGSLSKMKDGVPVEENRWLHLNCNLGQFDNTLNEKGVKTLIKYNQVAVTECKVGQKCSEKDGRRYNFEWDSFDATYQSYNDGKQHKLFVPTARICGGSGFYALVEEKVSDKGIPYWGTVPVNLVNADGTPRCFKDGKQITQSGWGFINSTLYPWAGCDPSSWEKPEYVREAKSHNRVIG